MSDLSPTPKEITAFISAASNGDCEAIVQFLADYPQAINKKGVDGMTALLWASRRGRHEAVTLLSERGAAIDEVDLSGWTSLMWASICGHRETVRILLEKGAAIEAKGGGRTALVWAVHHKHKETAALLLEKGAVVNESDRAGWTPLMTAVWQANIPMIQLLLEKRADLQKKDNTGKTAMDLAQDKGFEDIMALLEKWQQIQALADDIADFSPALKRPIRTLRRLNP